MPCHCHTAQVVGVISLLSGLLRLPPSLVGLTLLAWGNSLGDFFGNQAMARVRARLGHGWWWGGRGREATFW